MKVLVTGGTGFVGRALVRRLAEQGHELAVLTRSVQGRRPDHPGVRFIQGEPARPGPWQAEAAGMEAAVNLAGETIFQRWTPAVKQRIKESRISTTRNLVEALTTGGPGRGKILFNTSAVGYYGFRGDEDLDESGAPGIDFLAELTKEWENEAARAESAGVRVVRMRLGIVLSADGGALGRMIPLFRWGLGGRLGSGRQWFSWIHRADLIRAVLFLIDQPESKGPFNFTAPTPIRNADLAAALGRALKRPAALPAPGFMIRLLLGEFGSVLLEGQKVLPRKLLDLGFQFTFPTIEQAFDDLFR